MRPYYGKLGPFIAQAALCKSESCLPWPFSIRPDGYGEARHHHGGLAHHAVCVATHGPRPSEKHEAAHKCGKRACVNGSHLYWATGVENAADSVTHGTKIRGTKTKGSILNEDAVSYIRSSREKGVHLAEKFNTTPQNICKVRKRRSWKWLAA